MLPRLRDTLNFLPSPLESKPGIMIRDPLQFSNAVLIIPPELIECLHFFDGQHSALDLRAQLVRLTGDVNSGDIETSMQNALSEARFLEDEAFFVRKHEVEKSFADAPVRLASHAGGAYPDEEGELRATFADYLGTLNGTEDKKRLLAIAAPHVSPFGGAESYHAAYSALSPSDADRTFVVLGTSHYGESDRLGLTRKPFVTPYGETEIAADLVDELTEKLGPAALLEDYCHAIEHSIEFQVVCLQHLFGPKIRILPILCGGYTRSLLLGGMPEEDDGVRRIIGTLGDVAAREGSRLLWILGVDMAHMGNRYGDGFAATAKEDKMVGVERRDLQRIQAIEAGDAQSFWEQVQQNQDDLKWCGAAPFYTFLRAMPGVRGELFHYQQWNIDPESVVSFAGMGFRA